jgi:SagB-type dehydrogenase family enzyme
MDPESKRLGLLEKGLFIEPMARACLDQMWLKQAALHLLFITDLSDVDRWWGARGYRYAMVEAGRLGQQAYLAATAIGWGACGIGAIYDREAAELLNLSGSEALLYLVGIGPVRARKRRQ